MSREDHKHYHQDKIHSPLFRQLWLPSLLNNTRVIKSHYTVTVGPTEHNPTLSLPDLKLRFSLIDRL